MTDPQVPGGVLAHCRNCGKIVEVVDGWVAPDHLTPAGKKTCGGSGKPARRYEKFRDENLAREYHRALKRSQR